jgi:hypothetical protein
LARGRAGRRRCGDTKVERVSKVEKTVFASQEDIAKVFR